MDSRDIPRAEYGNDKNVPVASSACNTPSLIAHSRSSSGAHCPHCDHQIDIGDLIKMSFSKHTEVVPTQRPTLHQRRMSDPMVYTLGKQRQPEPQNPAHAAKRNSEPRIATTSQRLMDSSTHAILPPMPPISKVEDPPTPSASTRLGCASRQNSVSRLELLSGLHEEGYFSNQEAAPVVPKASPHLGSPFFENVPASVPTTPDQNTEFGEGHPLFDPPSPKSCLKRTINRAPPPGRLKLERKASSDSEDRDTSPLLPSPTSTRSCLSPFASRSTSISSINWSPQIKRRTPSFSTNNSSYFVKHQRRGSAWSLNSSSFSKGNKLAPPSGSFSGHSRAGSLAYPLLKPPSGSFHSRSRSQPAHVIAQQLHRSSTPSTSQPDDQKPKEFQGDQVPSELCFSEAVTAPTSWTWHTPNYNASHKSSKLHQRGSSAPSQFSSYAEDNYPPKKVIFEEDEEEPEPGPKSTDREPHASKNDNKKEPIAIDTDDPAAAASADWCTGYESSASTDIEKSSDDDTDDVDDDADNEKNCDDLDDADDADDDDDDDDDDDENKNKLSKNKTDAIACEKGKRGLGLLLDFDLPLSGID